MGPIDYRQLINEFRHNQALTVSLVALIVGAQAWMIVSQMYVHDTEPDYYDTVLRSILYCDPDKLPYQDDMPVNARNQLKWWLHCESWDWFGSVKVIPLMFNIGVMPLVYVLGSWMARDRLIGLIALVAFINNPLYTDWKDNGTYDQVWSFFLLLSIVLMYKTRYSVLPFFVSLSAKMLGLLYLPMWLYMNWQTRHSKKELAAVLCALAIGVAFIGSHGNLAGAPIGFFPERWEDAIYRNISVLWQVIPFAVFIMVNRTFIPKTKMPNQRMVGLWMLLILLQNPVIYLFTLQDTYSYRYVPLAAFMSVFIGMTLVNLGNWLVEMKMKAAPFKNPTTY